MSCKRVRSWLVVLGLSACATLLPAHHNGLKGKLDCSNCPIDEPMAVGTKRWLDIAHYVRNYQAILSLESGDETSPVRDDLQGPAGVVSENPRVATVEQVTRTNKSVYALVAARSVGRTQLSVTAGDYHDQFQLTVAQANEVQISCEHFDDLKTKNQATGLLVGQSMTCEIEATDGAKGLFVDVDPDPHLRVEKLVSGHHRRLRLDGLRPGLARLRVHSGAATMDIPIAVVMDDQAETSSLLVNNQETGTGTTITLGAPAPSDPLEDFFPASAWIVAQLKTADGRVARLPHPHWWIDDAAVARIEPRERDSPDGLFHLTAINPGSTRLSWESGKFRGAWMVEVAGVESSSATRHQRKNQGR